MLTAKVFISITNNFTSRDKKKFEHVAIEGAIKIVKTQGQSVIIEY